MSVDPLPPPTDLGTAALPAVARAIVVDDEPDTLDAASLALRSAGFEVTVAASGAAALRGLRDTGFDLVVLARIDVLRQIRAVHDVPVIMLGAGESEAERVLGLELGADDYVTKPFSPLELASRGRAIVRRRRSMPRDKASCMAFMVSSRQSG